MKEQRKEGKERNKEGRKGERGRREEVGGVVTLGESYL